MTTTPTPPASVDVAEGRRLLEGAASLPWHTAATDDTCVVDADNEEVCALAGNYGSQDEWPQMEARAALIVFAVNNLSALLTAAEQVAGLRRALQKAEAAVNAAYAQADAEFRNHDTRAAQRDKLIREWRAEARSALGAAP